VDKSDLRVQMTDEQFCTVQHQHLHQILEKMSATVSNTICHINLVSTDNESQLSYFDSPTNPCNSSFDPSTKVFPSCALRT